MSELLNWLQIKCLWKPFHIFQAWRPTHGALKISVLWWGNGRRGCHKARLRCGGRQGPPGWTSLGRGCVPWGSVWSCTVSTRRQATLASTRWGPPRKHPIYLLCTLHIRVLITHTDLSWVLQPRSSRSGFRVVLWAQPHTTFQTWYPASLSLSYSSKFLHGPCIHVYTHTYILFENITCSRC